eukprot:1160568-Pelagomonas_calceolata.AAC.10
MTCQLTAAHMINSQDQANGAHSAAAAQALSSSHTAPHTALHSASHTASPTAQQPLRLVPHH